MLKRKGLNKKGFSLVELLIVIAIMGVLAVIAFSAFNGVFAKSKKKADEQQAKAIEHSIKMLVTETGIPDLVANDDKFKTAPNDTATDAFGDLTVEGHVAVKNLITGLQGTIYVKDPTTGKYESYGPYLDIKDDAGVAKYVNYSPQWNPTASGKYVGYNIRIWTDTQNVIVNPAYAANLTDSYDAEAGTGALYTNSAVQTSLNSSSTTSINDSNTEPMS